jgi:hypothetical protein
MGVLNDLWKAAKYYQTGFEGATSAHYVLKLEE